jgi:hypothetical protein
LNRLEPKRSRVRGSQGYPEKSTKIKENKKIKEIKISVAKTIVFIRFEALGHAKNLCFHKDYQCF